MSFSEVVGPARRAALLGLITSFFILAVPNPLFALTVTLGWELSNDPSVVGYSLYYGAGSHSYTNMVVVGNTTSVSISNLTEDVTYYFAATSTDGSGLESDFSAEACYSPAGNQQPTLDLINDLTIDENGGTQTVNLTGITSGLSNEIQTLTVTAYSSNPALIPNPDVAYSSPDTNGTLSFAPTPNSFGTVTMTVMVDDGGTVSNSLIRIFTVTVNPFNDPPTLDPITDVLVNQDAGPQTVNLTGISAGGSNEVQPLTITATSSNPTLVPNPVVNYTSPNSSGSLAIIPTTNGLGTAVITVTVDDGQPLNHLTISSFAVTVNPVLPGPQPLTNAFICPNTTFKFIINPPFTNGDKLAFSLDTTAPAGAKINTKRGVSSIVWTPTSAQASTTNLFGLRVTDITNPELSTNEPVRVVVLDYVTIGIGRDAAQAGQSIVLPVTLDSSDGVTNLSFSIPWPTNRFANPSLFNSLSGVQSSSAQVQGTNLVIKVQAKQGISLLGSNVLAQLSFQLLAGQTSEFVNLPVKGLAATKALGAPYVNPVAQTGRLVVVANEPLLEVIPKPDGRSLQLYAKVGNSYQIQSTTSLGSPISWQPLLTYAQTNVSQPLNLGVTSPMIFYRLKQQ